jgi:hypothetical protein
MNMKRILTLFAASSLLATVAFAQAKPAPAPAPAEGGNTTYKSKTVYDFDDDLVEGDLVRPDGEFIDTKKAAKHSSLIKLRADFIPEMLKSAEDI